MIQYTDIVKDELSQLPIPGAEVFVYDVPENDGDPADLATLYAADGVTTIPNPLTTNNLGVYSFYQAAGEFVGDVYVGKRLRYRSRLFVGGGYSGAAQTAAAAALAAAGVGQYANTALGLAGTTLGETFWVDLGTGLGQVYRHDSGPVATPLQTFLTDPQGSGAASVLGESGGGSVQDGLNARPTTAALASSTGGAMVGLNLGGLLDDGIKFITAAMAGIPDDGNEATDVTAELTALASAAGALDLPVHLGARTYLTDGTTINFTTSVRGLPGTVIKSSATTAEQHVVTMSGDGTTLDMVEIDGNCSADPSPWNSGNYDSFTGNRGLKIDASGVTVSNVTVRNVRWAGFLVEAGARRVTLINCLADRCRGNFGDGFIAMGAFQVTFINCRAYDYTRIGFVADAYGEAPGQYSKEIAYINCSAEYGHDASILYGGGEYNNGFWCERSGQVTLDNCTSNNVTHHGFLLTTWSAATNIGQEQFALRNCVATDSQYGYAIRGFSAVPLRVVLDTCHADIRASSGEAAFNFGSTNSLDEVHLRNCSAVLRGTIVRRCSVRLGLGVVIVDGFNETWADIDTTLRDATVDNYYGSLSHFDNAPNKAVVSDWRTYDASGTQIFSVFKFLSTALASLDLTVERTRLRGVVMYANSYTFKDVHFERTGTIHSNERFVMRGGKITDGPATGAVQLRASTKEIRFEGVLLDFADSGGRLYLYNFSNNVAVPKFILRGCTIIKNIETNGYTPAIRVNAEGALVTTAGVNHVVFSDGVIVNTGGATTNPVVYFEGNSDAAGKLHGRGNLKSSSLTNIAGSSTGSSGTPGTGRLATASSFENWG